MQIIGIILILAVIGLYILWLWYAKNQRGADAKIKNNIQVFDILVKGVYSPGVIKAKLDKPIRINFRREESSECSRFVNFPDFKIRKELPEDKTVTIDIVADKPGVFIFTCDMSMYQGKLIIE
ncbi:MAG TPA: cupredoxin domain-containing protein [Patescibacteria group bacterium]|nr:cupredoxin domain-containing protein [Patescibacteria group bacterium]